MPRPSILFLTYHLPFPPSSGGRRREFELLRRLSATFDVHVCAVTHTYEQDVLFTRALEEHCESVDLLRAQSTAADELAVYEWGEGRFACIEAAPRVAELVERHRIDLVHVENYFLLQHVPRTLGVPIALIEQNVWRDLIAQQSLFVRHAGGRAVVDRATAAESSAWRRADILGALTAEDRDRILELDSDLKVHVLPNGCDHLCRTPARSGDGLTILFVANFRYGPNVDAARFLLTEVFPRVLRREPAAKMALVGGSPPETLRALAARLENVVVSGYVERVESWLSEAAVVACPLRIGGGVKVKMLEALAFGKAIVASPIAAQGLAGRGDSFLVADDADDFAEAILTVLTDRDRRAQLEMAALEHARQLPTWDESAELLTNCYRGLLRSWTQTRIQDSCLAQQAP